MSRHVSTRTVSSSPLPGLGGDLMDFAIGQGAFTATPLQVAVSYAVLVNGGKVMEPSVVKETIDAEGNVIPVIAPSPSQSISTRRPGIVAGRSQPCRHRRNGRSGVRRLRPRSGEHWGQDRHRTVVGSPGQPCLVRRRRPDRATRSYVVAVLIDEGGSGGQIAAPVGRHIMQFLWGMSRRPSSKARRPTDGGAHPTPRSGRRPASQQLRPHPVRDDARPLRPLDCS